MIMGIKGEGCKDKRNIPGFSPGNDKERSAGPSSIIESDNQVGIIEHLDISNQRSIPPVKVIIREKDASRNIKRFGRFRNLGIKPFGAAMKPSRGRILFSYIFKDRISRPFIPMAAKYNIHASNINENKRNVKTRL